MENIKFVWNTAKAKSNLLKHQIAFDEARTVFDDDNARLKYDPDHSGSEDRFILLGLSYKLRLLIVVHCDRTEENEIRIISARKATKRETQQYRRF